MTEQDRIKQLEQRLILSLGELIAQGADDSDEQGVYFSGYIRAYKTAMILACDVGIMNDVYTESNLRQSAGREFYARFVPGWEQKFQSDSK